MFEELLSGQVLDTRIESESMYFFLAACDLDRDL